MDPMDMRLCIYVEVYLDVRAIAATEQAHIRASIFPPKALMMQY